MSDHDRGAYTPHNDAPLSFDARQSRGRRAFPTTLLISLVVLIGLGVAIFMFYRSGVRGAGEAPQPVGAPVGEIKSPPSSQAQQPQDPGQGLQIYKAEGNAEAPASGATGFAPPPEQPQARPVAPVTAQPIAPAKPASAAAIAADPTATASAQVTQAAPAKPAVASAPKPAPVAQAPAPAVAQTKPAPAPAAAAKPAVAASKPAPKDEVGALLDSAKPAPSKKVEPAKPAAAAKAEAPSAASSVSHGAAVVQFGAFSSTDLASSEWAKLAKAYPTEMSGKGKLVEAVERDGKTLFRGAVSGFASKADAVAFCAKLKADSKACIVR